MLEQFLTPMCHSIMHYYRDGHHSLLSIVLTKSLSVRIAHLPQILYQRWCCNCVRTFSPRHWVDSWQCLARCHKTHKHPVLCTNLFISCGMWSPVVNVHTVLEIRSGFCSCSNTLLSIHSWVLLLFNRSHTHIHVSATTWHSAAQLMQIAQYM